MQKKSRSRFRHKSVVENKITWDFFGDCVRRYNFTRPFSYKQTDMTYVRNGDRHDYSDTSILEQIGKRATATVMSLLFDRNFGPMHDLDTGVPGVVRVTVGVYSLTVEIAPGFSFEGHKIHDLIMEVLLDVLSDENDPVLVD